MPAKHTRETCTINTGQMPLAESLCVPCLDDARPTKSPKTGNAALLRAWWHLEYAIATPDTDDKQAAVALAQEFCENSLAYRDKNSDLTRFKIGMFQAIFPAMLDRVENKPLQSASKQYANQAYGELLTSKHLGKNNSNRAGMRSEAMAAFLLSREDIADSSSLYVASPREESNGSSISYNHDFYQILEDTGDEPAKFALQVKSRQSRASHYSVPVIPLEQILRPVINRLEPQDMGTLTSMAIAEVRGHSNARYETTLDFASHCLESYVTSQMYNLRLDSFEPVPAAAL